jgi:hypothetical protein
MQCPNCSSANVDVASFCHKCGTPLRSSQHKTYAASSGERVNQFALISTVMPHTNRDVADNYRWAMIVSGVLVLGATALGLLPVAIAAAAFLIPIAYLVYIYDVNLWEDAPARVVGLLFAVTGALSILVSLFFFRWAFEDQFGSLLAAAGSGLVDNLPILPMLIFAVLLPLVAEVVKNAGAILLARRPQFDDMIDALTFGIAAGTAYAAFETIVLFWPVIASGELRATDGIATWFVVVLNLMVVKSLIYGTATGVAVAAFSGKGSGFDGFTAFYARNFAFAVIANILYWLGIRFLAYAPFGHALGLLWGALILGVLIVRVRVMLQAALLGAALEDAAEDTTSARDVRNETYCPECENILLAGSQFCITCGTSVRSTSKLARSRMLGNGQDGRAS